MLEYVQQEHMLSTNAFHPPQPVENISIKNTTYSSIEISWTPVVWGLNGIIGYNIYLMEAQVLDLDYSAQSVYYGGSRANPDYPIEGNNFVITGLKPGRVYWVTVTSVDGSPYAYESEPVKAIYSLTKFTVDQWENTPHSFAYQLTGYNIYDLWITSNGMNGWACGDYGKIYQLINGVWIKYEYEAPPYTLYALDMADLNTGYAVGESGQIVKCEFGEWNAVSDTLVSKMLNDIEMVNPNLGYIVGNYGAILKYEDGQWKVQSSPVPEHLYAIEMINETTGWICGENGKLLKLEGGSWILYSPSPTSAALYDIAMLNNNYGWACGANGKILHYNISSWSLFDEHPLQTPELQSIAIIDENTSYIFGDTLWKYDGVDWKEEFFSQSWKNIFNAAIKDQNTGWACGENGVLLSVEAGIWDNYIPGIEGVETIFDISMHTDNNGWIINDKGDLFNYHNGVWSKYDLRFFGLNVLEMMDWNAGYALGNNIIIKYQDQNWVNIDHGLSFDTINDISLLSNNTGWAVGDNGKVLRLKEGNWHLSPVPLTEDLNGVYTIDTDTACACGDNSTVLFYQNENWIEIDTEGLIFSANDIYCNQEGKGWIVCKNGLIFQYNGEHWSSYDEIIFTNTLYEMEMLDFYTGWAIGEKGSLLVCKGGEWQLLNMYLPYSELTRISITDDQNNVWITGENGIIIRGYK